MAKDFAALDTSGGARFQDSEGLHGFYGYLDDGLTVTMRITSTDGRPTLDIKELDETITENRYEGQDNEHK